MLLDLIIFWYYDDLISMLVLFGSLGLSMLVIIAHYIGPYFGFKHFPLQHINRVIPLLLILAPAVILPIRFGIRLLIIDDLATERAVSTRDTLVSAIANYEESTGRYPQTLDELQPDFLNSIPIPYPSHRRARARTGTP